MTQLVKSFLKKLTDNVLLMILCIVVLFEPVKSIFSQPKKEIKSTIAIEMRKNYVDSLTKMKLDSLQIVQNKIRYKRAKIIELIKDIQVLEFKSDSNSVTLIKN
ncbi:MAG: hypothetical protein ABI091_26845 [Ferruginibacter sp.]